VKKTPFLIAVVAFLIVGCGPSVNVTMKPNTTFTTQSSITIVGPFFDPVGVQGKLEHLFLSRGFNVVSEAVAQDRTVYQDKIDNKVPGESSAQASLHNVKELRSAYALRYGYGTKFGGLIYGDIFSGLSATIIDLRSGAVVGSVSYSSSPMSASRTVDSVLEEVVNKLVGASDLK
jgi:hypothetical protein